MIIQHEDTNTVLTEQDLIDIYMEGYNEGIQAVEEDTAVKKWLRKNIDNIHQYKLYRDAERAIEMKNLKFKGERPSRRDDISYYNKWLRKRFDEKNHENIMNQIENGKKKGIAFSKLDCPRIRKRKGYRPSSDIKWSYGCKSQII